MRFAGDVASKFRDGVLFFLTLMSPYSSSPRISMMRFTPSALSSSLSLARSVKMML